MPNHKKNRTLFERIKDIVKAAKKLEIFQGDIESVKDLNDLLEVSLGEKLNMYEKQISDERKEQFVKQLRTINKQVEALKDHTDSALGLADVIIKKVNAVVEAVISEVTQKPESSIKEISLPHIEQFAYRGVKSIVEDPHGFEFALSQTEEGTRKLIIRKKRTEQIESPYDAEFVIGITNCPVSEPLSDLILTTKTLEGASLNDIEVFDAIHELDRCGYKFALGILAFKDFSNPPVITNSYNLTELMKAHQEATKAKSLLIRVVAESKNLQHETSLTRILNNVPFDHLVAKGVKEICLDIMSCNTVEMMQSAMKQVEEIAKKYHIKMTANFYDGFVQNNISYCYINPAQQKKILAELEKRMVPGTETDPAIPFSEIEVKDATSVVRDFGDKFKSDAFVKVVYPGFSVVGAKSALEMKKFVIDKTIRGRTTSVSELSRQDSTGRDSPGSPGAGAAGGEAESSPAKIATARVMLPVKDGEELPKGKIISCSVDYRVKEQEHSAAAAASATASEPSSETARRGDSSRLKAGSLQQTKHS